jgi:hypothetical protein
MLRNKAIAEHVMDGMDALYGQVHGIPPGSNVVEYASDALNSEVRKVTAPIEKGQQC